MLPGQPCMSQPCQDSLLMTCVKFQFYRVKAVNLPLLVHKLSPQPFINFGNFDLFSCFTKIMFLWDVTELIVSLHFPVQGHNVVRVIMEESEDYFVVSWNNDPMLPVYLLANKVGSP